MTDEAKLSKAETLKRESGRLRGTVAESLAAGGDRVTEDEYQILKFHGTYQQYDRDTATDRKRQGLDKEYQFMVRARIPAGRLTAAQYLVLDELADRYGNGTLRITTRQGIQFHGVVKDGLKGTIAAINDAMLTTLCACGDVVRNITAPAAPIKTPVYRRLEEEARNLSRRLLPNTRAYHEIWLDGEKLETAGTEAEPLYGETYLPRKFKVGLAIPEDNAVDVLANDLAVIALFEGDVLQGFNLALGGGLGMTHNKPKTYPRLATPIVFVPPEDLGEAVEAAIRLQRDHGDRSDRRHARLKYLVEEQGVDWIKARLEEAFGRPMTPARPMPRFKVPDQLGWREQGDGRWYIGIPVSSGRVADFGAVRIRLALREIVTRFDTPVVLLPSQDIILHEIAPEDRAEITAVLRAHGVTLDEDLSPVQRWSMACPALPTCGLALTEAERIKDPTIGAIEQAMTRHGLRDERLSIRITGCPNGCARSYAGDIGLVGRMPGHYALYVGGDFEGTRLSFRLLDKVALEKVAETLEPLFAAFAGERNQGEAFGDWCNRLGADALLALIGTAKGQVVPAAAE